MANTMNGLINGSDDQQKENEKTKSDLFSAIESKENLTLPNVIICRRYRDDQQNDMNAIRRDFPEIEKNITYLSNPNQIKDHVKADQKNIIFLGQYFNHNKTGTETAREIKSMGLNTEIILISSIDVSYGERDACDRFFSINKMMNQSDGADMIVNYLKNKAKK